MREGMPPTPHLHAKGPPPAPIYMNGRPCRKGHPPFCRPPPFLHKGACRLGAACKPREAPPLSLPVCRQERHVQRGAGMGTGTGVPPTCLPPLCGNGAWERGGAQKRGSGAETGGGAFAPSESIGDHTECPSLKWTDLDKKKVFVVYVIYLY